MNLSHRQRIMLAALAAERGSSFAPVQVQKLFFLLDQNISEDLGGPSFRFEPYDYGPFDREVYGELEVLARQGLVTIESSPKPSRRQYSLTLLGQNVGENELSSLGPRAQDYMARLLSWIRSLSFAELVGSIYRQYPEMKANSVFRG